jgi:hypothetical protein
MTKYMDFIEGAELIGQVDGIVTTGDSEYPGTAMEVRAEGGDELFHIVVDASGARQVLFLEHRKNYRVSLSKMEEIIAKAKEVVRFCEGG